MSKPIEDLTGKKYGKLTVLRQAMKKKGEKTQWICRCKCGKETVVFATNLKSRATTSCDCLKKGFRKLKENPTHRKKLHPGTRYGNLLIWGLVGRGRYRVTCNCTRCSPGGVLFSLRGEDIVSGRRKSCRVEDRKHSALRRDHPREHASYAAMIRRTSDPTDKNYGGRGISVAEEWEEEKGGFESFLDYMLRSSGPCPEGCTLDRIRVNVAYEPGNLRWATTHEQARNKTTSRLVDFMGSRLNIVDFAKLVGWNWSKVGRWLDKGRTPEEIAKEARSEFAVI